MVDESERVYAFDAGVRKAEELIPRQGDDGELVVDWGDAELILDLPVRPQGTVVIVHLAEGWNSRSGGRMSGPVCAIHFHKVTRSKSAPVPYAVLDVRGDGAVTLLSKSGTSHTFSFDEGCNLVAGGD